MRLILTLLFIAIYYPCMGQFGYEFWPYRDYIIKISDNGQIDTINLPKSTNLTITPLAIGDKNGNIQIYGDARTIWNANHELLVKSASQPIGGRSVVVQDLQDESLFHYIREYKNTQIMYIIEYITIDISSGYAQIKSIQTIHTDSVTTLAHAMVDYPRKAIYIIIGYQYTLGIFALDKGKLINVNNYQMKSKLKTTYGSANRITNNSSYSKIILTNSKNETIELNFDKDKINFCNPKIYDNHAVAITMSANDQDIYFINENESLMKQDITKPEKPIQLVKALNSNHKKDKWIKKGPDNNIYIINNPIEIIENPDSEKPLFKQLQLQLNNNYENSWPSNNHFNHPSFTTDLSCKLPHFEYRGYPYEKIHWDFGDGTSSTDPSPEHAYAAPGKYTVKMTASFHNGDTKTVSKEIEVSATHKPIIKWR